MTTVAQGAALLFSAAKVRALLRGETITKRRHINYNPAYIAAYAKVPPADWARECPLQPGCRYAVRGQAFAVEVQGVSVVYTDQGIPASWDVRFARVAS